jgi:hypothetical protein
MLSSVRDLMRPPAGMSVDFNLPRGKALIEADSIS